MKEFAKYQYLSDIDLIENVKCNNCNDSMRELQERHSGICHSMIKKYYNTMSSVGVDPNEIAKDKSLIMYRSVLNFDTSKNIKFSTWLGNQMRFHCLNCMNKNNVLISMDNDGVRNVIEKKQSEDTDNLLILKEKIDFVFNVLKQLKDKRIEKIFKLRYFSDKKNMSWSKIGRKLKISTQTVINLHDKTINFLKNKLESDNLQDTI